MLEILKEFENRKVLIWGLGREGLSTLAFLRRHLPDQVLYVSDLKEPQGLEENCVFVPQDESAFHEYDMIMKAPGVVVGDQSLVPLISGQTPLFLKYYGAQTIGITGTKGKSTTSSLMYHVLKENGNEVFLVGNIGIPCFDILEDITDNSLVVFEVSCHQLEYSPYSPKIGVLLNLFEEHIDHYGTYELYKHAKEHVFLHMHEGDTCLINGALKPQLAKAHDPIRTGIGGDVYNMGRNLYSPLGSVSVRNCSLIGEHNYDNSAIVYHIAKMLGVSDEVFLAAMASFSPLDHRLQDCGIYKGITFVDDSISTIPQATIQGCSALGNVGSVLVGGMDRHIDYSDLEEWICECTVPHIILMYATGKRIYEELDHSKVSVQLHLVDDLDEAVKKAFEVTPQGTACLLSPAAASYGYFKNFEERGDVFKALVKQYGE